MLPRRTSPFFEPSSEKIEVKNETRITSPIQRTDVYNPLPGDDQNHHVVLSWLLNESHDPIELLETILLSNILLDNSASPLRKALENSRFQFKNTFFFLLQNS